MILYTIYIYTTCMSLDSQYCFRITSTVKKSMNKFRCIFIWWVWFGLFWATFSYPLLLYIQCVLISYQNLSDWYRNTIEPEYLNRINMNLESIERICYFNTFTSDITGGEGLTIILNPIPNYNIMVVIKGRFVLNKSIHTLFAINLLIIAHFKTYTICNSVSSLNRTKINQLLVDVYWGQRNR